MKTVHEVSEISGVSIRALHYYDSIGLLKPAAITDAGYRLYSEKELKRLQSILFFRELEFSLGEIKKILDEPSFDEKAALKEQIKLLEMRKKRIDELISLAKKTLKQGVTEMDFSPFDKSELKKYAAEAKEKWGQTKEFREFEKRKEKRSDDDEAEIEKGMEKIFADFGKFKNLEPSDSRVQDCAARLQNYITENYYPCSKEIFACLGKMYAQDERFEKNIDKIGGNETASFVSRAIEIFCD